MQDGSKNQYVYSEISKILYAVMFAVADHKLIIQSQGLGYRVWTPGSIGDNRVFFHFKGLGKVSFLFQHATHTTKTWLSLVLFG